MAHSSPKAAHVRTLPVAFGGERGTPLGSLTRAAILAHLAARLGAVAVIAVVLVGLRRFDPGTSHHSVLVHGLIDESGHLLTALMAALGVRALRLPIPLWAVLVGGVVLDGGHLLTGAGLVHAVPGSSRDGSHSLVVVAAIAAVGFLDARRATVWLGLALGALTHLVRDMGTGTVPLLWPVVMSVESTTFTRYLSLMVGVSVAAICSGALLDTYAHVRRTRGGA